MATHALPSHIFVDDNAPAITAPRKPSLMRRVYEAIVESQRRRAQRDIDRVLGRGALDRAFRTELPLGL